MSKKHPIQNEKNEFPLWSSYNLVTLSINLSMFVESYFLKHPKNDENFFVFILGFSLHLVLLIMSLVQHCYSAKKKKTKLNFVFDFFLQRLVFFIPFFEILIFVNLEMRFLVNLQWANYSRFVYFLIKSLIISIKNIKSIFSAIFLNCILILVILLNLSLIYGLETKILFSFIVGFLQLVYSLIIFFKITKVSKNQNDAFVFKTYIDEMSKPMIIFKEKSLAAKKSNNYELIYNTASVLELLEINKKEISFNDLNQIFKFFKIVKKKNGTETLQSSYNPLAKETECQNLIEDFSDLLSYPNSCENNEKSLFILEKLSNFPNEKKSELKGSNLNLMLTLKKKMIKKKLYFFIEIKRIKINEMTELRIRLLTTICHELKTPLNGSLCLLELLKNEKNENDETSNFYLENSFACMKILENTLNNLIDYSLLLSNQMLVSISPVNLNNLMYEIFIITKSQAQMKNLDYHIEIQGSLAKNPIFTDQIRLKQILLNLILNSIQFTNEGSIIIQISIISVRPLVVKFKIQDSGIGMDEYFCANLIKKINDKNFEFNANTTGSCMGMTISNELSFLLGKKTLEIQSKLDKGTIVNFEIIDQNIDSEPYISKHSSEKLIILNNFDSKLVEIIESSKKIQFIRQQKKLSNKAPGTSRNIENDELSFTHIKGNNAKSVASKINSEIGLSNYSFSEFRQKSNSYSREISSLKGKTEHTYLSVGTANVNIFFTNDGVRPSVFSSQSFTPNDCFSNLVFYKGKKKRSLSFNAEMNENNVEECICEDVLIVDDDAFNLLSLELLLKKNFKILSIKVMNGKEAVERVKSQKCGSSKCRGFVLVFMDYQMPVMDGIEAMKIIEQMIKNNEIHDGISVIGCTAFTTKDQVLHCLNAGMKDVIFKPLNKEIVGTILDEWYYKYIY